MPIEQSTTPALRNSADRECPALLSPSQLAAARLPLEKASTLPAHVYTSPQVYQREVEQLFLREWICVGRVDQVQTPGNYFTLDLLGDKLVVTRDKEGTIHVLSRVCRHRAAEIVQGTGNAQSFQCPYHRWTYRLDGQLIDAPFMEQADGFDKTACRLPELRSEIWEGFIFVNFDANAQPLGPTLAPLAKMLANYKLSEMVTTEPLVYDSRYNWKVLVENFMESYHHIGPHSDTLRLSFPASRSFAVDNEGPYSILVLPGNDDFGPDGFSVIAGLEEWQRTSLIACVVYPFHLFALSAHNLAWYQILPNSVDHFTLLIHLGFPRSAFEHREFETKAQEHRELAKTIHQEDIDVCESVWGGLNSRQARPGRLSHLEKALWQLNKWWIERMVES
jgi:phenylpropionate dioxygenase-like ring-hydroxylating dioxygenase large terminal subunit